ncbi:MAG: hypothetical protein RRY78_01670 [Clostridia bacterium]
MSELDYFNSEQLGIMAKEYSKMLNRKNILSPHSKNFLPTPHCKQHYIEMLAQSYYYEVDMLYRLKFLLKGAPYCGKKAILKLIEIKNANATKLQSLYTKITAQSINYAPILTKAYYYCPLLKEIAYFQEDFIQTLLDLLHNTPFNYKNTLANIYAYEQTSCFLLHNLMLACVQF